MPNRYSIVGMAHQDADAFVKALEVGVDALLVREPTNQFDPNAVAVWIGGRRVGYIPKKQNAVLAPFIDQKGTIAMDASIDAQKAIAAKFVRSPNSGYPMVEV